MTDNPRLIPFVIILVFDLAILFYWFTISKRQRKFKQDMNVYGLDTPDEIVSEKEKTEILSEFKKVFVKPYTVLSILIIISSVSSIIVLLIFH